MEKGVPLVALRDQTFVSGAGGFDAWLTRFHNHLPALISGSREDTNTPRGMNAPALCSLVIAASAERRSSPIGNLFRPCTLRKRLLETKRDSELLIKRPFHCLSLAHVLTDAIAIKLTSIANTCPTGALRCPHQAHHTHKYPSKGGRSHLTRMSTSACARGFPFPPFGARSRASSRR